MAAALAFAVLLSSGWLVNGSRVRREDPAGLAVGGRQWPTQFVVVAPGASRVSVVGDFNNWDPQGTPLQKGSDGIWMATVALPAGVYAYSYWIDGRLEHSTDEPGSRDEFGGANSIVIVGEESL
jgi:1,4-alpha-glucan branching enzyme